jgi:uncharacterized protein (DUF1778 family)
VLTETDAKTRAARLDVRMTTDQQAMLQHAAALFGRTLSCTSCSRIK